MGVNYKSNFTCDKCGKIGLAWSSVLPKTTVMAIARSEGWQIGKYGWFCPECKTKVKTEK